MSSVIPVLTWRGWVPLALPPVAVSAFDRVCPLSSLFQLSHVLFEMEGILSTCWVNSLGFVAYCELWLFSVDVSELKWISFALLCHSSGISCLPAVLHSQTVSLHPWIIKKYQQSWSLAFYPQSLAHLRLCWHCRWKYRPLQDSLMNCRSRPFAVVPFPIFPKVICLRPLSSCPAQKLEFFELLIRSLEKGLLEIQAGYQLYQYTCYSL